jgi:hypothetical protein
LCHLGFHVFLCRLAISHLHMQVVFVVSYVILSFWEKIVRERIWD